MVNTSRQEHLAWCKQRAEEELAASDVSLALASLISDLGKHPDTADAAKTVAELGMTLAVAGFLDTPEQMREFIDGVF